MEILLRVITIILSIGLIASPFCIIFFFDKLNWRKKFVWYMISGIVITFIITAVIGWWSYFSNHVLLAQYGYDFDNLNATERLQNVAPENLERVKVLNKNRLGVGWPLKVIMSYIFFSPILLILYILVFYFKVGRKKINFKNSNQQ